MAESALVIATVMETAAERIERAIERARLEGADAVEVRFDAAPGVHPESVGASLGTGFPLIAACRASHDGGKFQGSEEERIGVLERAARTGRFGLDVEWGTLAETLLRDHPDWVRVLSYHDHEATPPGLLEKVRAMLAVTRPGQIVKLVTTARSPLDLLKVRDLLRDARASSRFAAFAMGEFGRPSRILSSAWGSAAVWAAADASSPGAPAQIELSSLLGLYRVRGSTPRTRVFAVAGLPVSRSLSPAIHNEAFRILGLDAVYVPLACESASDLERVIDALPLDGISITAPLKVAVLSLLDDADSLVRTIGACNTIVVGPRPGEIAQEEPESLEATGHRNKRGYNTDGNALVEEVRVRLDPAGREVIVIGAGGAARAAAHALAFAGARVTIAARDAEAGRGLAREVAGAFRDLSSLDSAPEGVLIQASSAPMDEPIVPESACRAALVIDMRYGPHESALIANARRQGVDGVDGLGMLCRQAQAQVRLFTGFDVSLVALRKAAERARDTS